MKVYHASICIVKAPDTQHSRQYLDFGPGFYVTTLLEQARNYAERFTRRGREAWINTYELSDDLSGWKVLRFDNYDERWLDYVTECRAGRTPDEVDFVIGGIANDKVFRTLDLYFSGDITKEEALRKLIYDKPNVQICIRTQRALDACLTYINGEKL